MTTGAPAVRSEATSVTTAGPEMRGRLDIHPTVLRKIIEHTADQVPGTLRGARRVAGIGVGTTGASARISAGGGAPAVVDVRLELALGYPCDVRAVVAAVRTRVEEQLWRLAGHRLRTLAVTVTGLRGLPAPPRLG
ncbi:Asp23/Gls24 family envelope stress response protein [Pseudonocardia asaccharolytica]|uniref:Asp23/Gls24 family envelope stress response protein n=1 Tax=Pseudonocardia asaccharolytica DSM 44247 = NBRC 16224 TaxID=1123024 RepID=A0A511DAA5_9PSEU|nr:Asp23/Gls24 family envelope stress response protein [Pseudonocardia asaccharolytica]GEL20584.1 hypothetical protein PA7_44210 [Pseudonocardia asaccharolytica DSM 44247 = NBRC 16224]